MRPCMLVYESVVTVSFASTDAPAVQIKCLYFTNIDVQATVSYLLLHMEYFIICTLSMLLEYVLVMSARVFVNVSDLCRSACPHKN